MGMGASFIEVHFTDDKTRDFRNHHLSIDVNEIKHLVTKAEQITTLLGTYEKKPIAEIETEQRIREFRRAVYLKEDQPKRTVLTEEMLTTLRPNKGIDVKEFYSLVGKKLLVDKKGFETFGDGEIG